MKRKTLRLLSFSIATIFIMAFILSCDKNDNNNNNNSDMYTISASMTGAQEVPANATAGTGTTTGTYNAATNSLQYNVTWSGLTGTASLGHFHGPALAGVNATPVITFNLINSGTSGSASGTVPLTDAQEADLLAGKWYTNIHTAANTGGEIRGQVAAVH